MDRRLGKLLGILVCGLVVATRLNAAETDPQVVSVLRSWEATSAERGREGLTVRSLQPFLGPIREATLLLRFTWRVLGTTELEATPSDPAERQFLPSVKIAVDADGQPRTLTIGKLQRDVRDLVRAEIRQVAARESSGHDSGIVLASFNPGGEVSSKPTPDRRVNEVLTRWLASSKAANALRTRFHRIDYDSATEVETHADGVFVYCAPYQGLYHSQPSAKFPADSVRVGLEGRRYVQLPGEESMLLWSGKELAQISLSNQSYQVFQRPGTPREVLGAGSFDAVWQALVAPQTALPLVVGLQESELRTNYEWEVITDDKNAITLYGTAVSGSDALLYFSAEVVLDPNTFRTRATRMVDAARSKETIHRFSESVWSKEVATLGQWKPDLSKFQRVAEAPNVEPVPSLEAAQSAPDSTLAD